MAIDKFVEGRAYKWDEYNTDYDQFVVTGVDETLVYYTYPLWVLSEDRIFSEKLSKIRFEDIVPLDVEESSEAENNQLSPNVYQFPNGVEVKDISAHLTSFGGQAVQYIARATRLDGVVKGLPIQDLYKAIELLKWEAERMEALQK